MGEGYRPDHVGGRCGCVVAASVLLGLSVIFIGMIFGDGPDEAARARQSSAGHLLWIAPLWTLVIFFAVRWIVERLRRGRP